MNSVLMALGMPLAFDAGRADFRDMAVLVGDNIFISAVIHKTFISVDELGTRAGAVTMVVAPGSSAAPQQPKIVNLDRPFVFAIIDNATFLPIIIGTLLTV